MINAKTRKTIWSVLTTERFQATDFEMEEDRGIDDAGDEFETLTIRYLPDDVYLFQLVATHGIGGIDLKAYLKPGTHRDQEDIRLANFDSLAPAIEAWRHCLLVELTNSPLARQVAEQQEEIRKIYERLGHVEDDYFTKAEAQKLAAELEAFKQHVAQEMKKNAVGLPWETQEGKATLRREIQELKDEIDRLKLDVAQLKKPGVLYRFGQLIYRLTKNPTMAKLLADGAEEAIKKMLPPGS